MPGSLASSMKRFECPNCSAPLFFANLRCGTCGEELQYEPTTDDFALLSRPCSQRVATHVCNWVAGAAEACRSCSLDSSTADTELAVPFQQAKRRTLRQLHGFRVSPENHEPTLRFNLLTGTPSEPVTTGHAGGTVTLDISEADPARREQLRKDLGETYRTPLGHVRHEVGHWWWAAWSARASEADLVAARELFGDERAEYESALATHYQRTDDGSWQEDYISFYASSHPFEDFAESFAHFLHVEDTLETAADHGMVDRREGPGSDDIAEVWPPLASAINEISLSMGTEEPYPFSPSRSALAKVSAAGATLKRTDAGPSTGS